MTYSNNISRTGHGIECPCGMCVNSLAEVFDFIPFPLKMQHLMIEMSIEDACYRMLLEHEFEGGHIIMKHFLDYIRIQGLKNRLDAEGKPVVSAGTTAKELVFAIATHLKRQSLGLIGPHGSIPFTLGVVMKDSRTGQTQQGASLRIVSRPKDAGDPSKGFVLKTVMIDAPLP